MDSTYEMVKELIDFNCQGVDTYNHNGSTWLIFTDNKKWVIELTKEKTLWYNYYFFTGVFKYLSLDVVENQHYITKWVEDTIINGAISTKGEYYKQIQEVEDTIQNGVKYTSWGETILLGTKIENAIQNGVKETHSGCDLLIDDSIEDTIQNGVKYTIDTTHHKNKLVEDTTQNGVKHTEYGDWLDGDERFDDIIQNGVKHTEKSLQIDGSCVVEDVIQNGIKETHDDVYHHKGRVGGVIKNGIKETKLIDYSDNTEFIVNGVISRGIKE